MNDILIGTNDTAAVELDPHFGNRQPATRGAAMSRRNGIPGLSFSWKRALGISGAKASLSRKIGIPLTESGLERKLGRSLLRTFFDALFGGRR